MTTTLTKKRFPLDRCQLRGDDVVKFELLAADPAQPQIKREWSMLAHTGTPVKRWWGSLVLDLGGALFSQRLALLMDHEVTQRLGFSTEVKSTARGLEAKGKLLSNPIADQVLKESGDGFPFQASLMAVPTKIEEVQMGAEAVVNGQTLKGPLTIFREWSVRELTLTVLGADPNTTTEAFAGGGEHEVEVLTMTKTIEVPDTDPANPSQVLATKPPAVAAPQLAPKAPTDAERERNRVSAILAAADDQQQQLARELIASGAELTEALSKLNANTQERLRAARSLLRVESHPLGGGNGSGGDGSGSGRVPAQLKAIPPSEDQRKDAWRQSPRLRQEFTMHGETDEAGLARFLAYARFASKHLKGAEFEQALAIDTRAELLGDGNLAPLTVRGVRGDFYLGLETRDLTWLRMIATVYDTDAPQEDYPFLGVIPRFNKFESVRQVQEVNRGKLTILNDDYEGTIQIAGKDWRRDKTGQIALLVQQMGDAASEKPIDMITALLNAGTTTALAWDGIALFGSHTWGKSGTINNNLGTGDGLAGGADPTTAQQVANIWLLISRLLSFKDDQGRPMNQRARSFSLQIPPNLIKATESALSDIFSSAGVSNPIASMISRGRFLIDYSVNAALTATDTMFLWRTDARVKPFVYQEEFVKPPYVLAEGSEHYQKTNMVEIGGHMACGAAPGKFELIARGKLA